MVAGFAVRDRYAMDNRCTPDIFDPSRRGPGAETPVCCCRSGRRRGGLRIRCQLPLPFDWPFLPNCSRSRSLHSPIREFTHSLIHPSPPHSLLLPPTAVAQRRTPPQPLLTSHHSSYVPVWRHMCLAAPATSAGQGHLCLKAEQGGRIQHGETVQGMVCFYGV